jgi:hypothetical protein
MITTYLPLATERTWINSGKKWINSKTTPSSGSTQDFRLKPSTNSLLTLPTLPNFLMGTTNLKQLRNKPTELTFTLLVSVPKWQISESQLTRITTSSQGRSTRTIRSLPKTPSW